MDLQWTAGLGPRYPAPLALRHAPLPHAVLALRAGGGARLGLDPGRPDPNLEEISWDEWFRGFDANHLAFLYEERTADGKPSGFHKLISRDSVEAHGRR
jgi:hypothetical protein